MTLKTLDIKPIVDLQLVVRGFAANEISFFDDAILHVRLVHFRFSYTFELLCQFYGHFSFGENEAYVLRCKKFRKQDHVRSQALIYEFRGSQMKRSCFWSNQQI